MDPSTVMLAGLARGTVPGYLIFMIPIERIKTHAEAAFGVDMPAASVRHADKWVSRAKTAVMMVAREQGYSLDDIAEAFYISSLPTTYSAIRDGKKHERAEPEFAKALGNLREAVNIEENTPQKGEVTS